MTRVIYDDDLFLPWPARDTRWITILMQFDSNASHALIPDSEDFVTSSPPVAKTLLADNPEWFAGNPGLRELFVRLS